MNAEGEYSVFRTWEAVSPVNPTRIIGIMGRVHGERKVKTPAKKDTPNPSLFPRIPSRESPKAGSFMLVRSQIPITASKSPEILFITPSFAPDFFSQFHIGVRNNARVKNPRFIPRRKPSRNMYAWIFG